MDENDELKFLKSLSKQYPTIAAASTEIINLQSILNLPKSTEHFLTDIHGEYEQFNHVLKNGSGSVKRKIEEEFGNTLTGKDKKSLATLIYYPEEKLDIVMQNEDNISDWYKITIHRLVQITKRVASKYTRSKVRKALPKDFAYIIEELITEKEELVDKEEYYNSIIETIIRIGRAPELIVALSNLIQRLVIDHLHIVGDIFDRGQESIALYNYLKELTDKKKAIVLTGNHHFMLIDFLECNNPYLCFFNYRRNGLSATIDDFSHRTMGWDTLINLKYSSDEQRKMSDQDWNKEWELFIKDTSKEINEEFPDLLPWLKSLPDFLELKNSIITHGMIDCTHGNWRTPLQGWKDCHWAKPKDAAFLRNDTGKHIYLGHIDADTIRECYHLEPDNETLFTRPGGDVTYLDSCTILTHKVNMVVIDDEPIND